MPDAGTVADREVAEAVAGSFLARLSSDLVDTLLEVGERTDYPAGSTVYREGSYPRSFLVVRGLLRVYLTSPEGRQCLSSTNHEGGSDEVHQHDHDQAAPG